MSYHVASVPLDACVDALMKGINAAPKSFWLACLNPHSVQIAMKDKDAADHLPDRLLKIYEKVIMESSDKIIRIQTHEPLNP